MGKFRPPTHEQLMGWRKIVGIFVRGQRLSRKMTQADVADSLGWARTTLVAIEKGRQAVSVDQLMILSALYRCHVTDFLPLKLDDFGRQRY